MSRLFVSGVAVVALAAAMVPAPASGVTHDKLAYLTFSAPVQVPGVTLGAGTYRFHLTNPDTSRNVLQVLSNDGTIVYAMFHTIPDLRTTLIDEATVTFRETPAGVPFAAFLPLVRASVDNVEAMGARRALTGPAARGDHETIARHLAAIDGSERPLYRALSDAARTLASASASVGDDQPPEPVVPESKGEQ